MYLKPLHSLKSGFISLHLLLRALLLPLLSLGLSACSQLPIANQGDNSAEASSDNWELTAKLGIRQGEQSTSAKLLWRQCDENYHIRLSGAFGITGADIKGEPGQVVLRRPGAEPVSAESPEALLADYGWIAPVSALRYWLRGQAMPEQAHSRHIDDDGALSGIDQGGWQIRYTPSLGIDDQPQLSIQPQRSSIRREAFELLLVGQRWQRNSNCRPESSARAPEQEREAQP